MSAPIIYILLATLGTALIIVAIVGVLLLLDWRDHRHDRPRKNPPK